MAEKNTERQKVRNPAAEGDALIFDLSTEIDELRAALAERKARLESCERYREALTLILGADPQGAHAIAREALDG